MVKSILKYLLTILRCKLGQLNGASVAVGNGSYLAAGIFFSSARNIKIGRNCYIGRNVSLSCHLDIGNFVLIASDVAFVGGDHVIDGINDYIINSGRGLIRKIVIEDD
ncbi:unnamed protein product, partial [Ectocarpus sp. 8 AP-2014]